MTTTPTVWLDEKQANLSDSGTGGDDQSGQQIVGLADGTFIVLWEDNSDIIDGDNGTDIIGQRYDAEGNKLGLEFQANSPGFFFDDEGDFTATALANGNFAIAYEDTDVDGTSIRFGIRGPDGTSVTNGTILSDPGADILGTPTITAAADSSFLVTYQRQIGAAVTTEVVKVSAAGVASAPLTAISGSDAGFQTGAATLTNGEFVVVSRYGDADDAIAFRRVSATGTPLGGATFVANTATNGDNDLAPAVAALSGGGFVVGWTNTDATDTDIELQRYDAAGTTVGAVITVQAGGSTDNNNELKLIGLSDGGFVVVWDDDEDNTIKLQRYGAGGGLVGAEVTVTQSDTETAPSVSLTDDGRLLVGWTTTVGGNSNVEFEIYDSREETINGGSGADLITSRIDGATVNGFLGNDTLLGQGADDTLNGGNDFDSLDGGGGNDLLQGNLDNDTVNGGEGDDTIFAMTQADATGSNAGDHLNGDGGNDTITGSNGGDTIDGGSENDSINGGIGNDLLQGGFSGDTVNGGDGADRIFAATEADSDGSGVGDSLNGDLGDDSIRGSGGGDTLFGGVDDDLLEGSGGSDNIAGGTGNDRLFGNTQALPDGSAAGDTLNGGTGDDTINGSAGADIVDGHFDSDLIFGGGGNDTLQGNFGADTINGGAGADVIHADIDGFQDDTSANTLNGDAGNDTIQGSEGTDLLDGGLDADSLNGGNGIDEATYVASLAAVTVNLTLGTGLGGSAQGDTLANIEIVTGSDFKDTLTGDSFANTLNGGLRDDTLTGGGGLDSISGGDGNDLMIVLLGNTVDNFDGGAGIDTVDFSDTALGGTYDLTAGTYDLGIPLAMLNVENLSAGDGADSIFGTSKSNVLSGNDGADTIDGDAKNDTINGNDGADSLFGGAGADVINGGLLNDTIDGNSGADSINGGFGLDSLIGNGGDDTVDGGDGNDTIQGQEGQDLLIGGVGADDITGNADGDTINGGGDNDTIRGGSEKDLLTGGTGADTFRFVDLTDSTVTQGARDRILDFSTAESDKIDVSKIDADVTQGGNQSFLFVGAFSGAARELRAKSLGGGVYQVQGDVDGDGSADFSIDVVSATALVGTDFVL